MDRIKCFNIKIELTQRSTKSNKNIISFNTHFYYTATEFMEFSELFVGGVSNVAILCWRFCTWRVCFSTITNIWCSIFLNLDWNFLLFLSTVSAKILDKILHKNNWTSSPTYLFVWLRSWTISLPSNNRASAFFVTCSKVVTSSCNRTFSLASLANACISSNSTPWACSASE